LGRGVRRGGEPEYGGEIASMSLRAALTICREGQSLQLWHFIYPIRRYLGYREGETQGIEGDSGTLAEIEETLFTVSTRWK